jgi:ribosome-associated translation inhibitor RaiA
MGDLSVAIDRGPLEERVNIPLEIAFHNVDRSPAVETAVRERVAKLEQFAEITSCRVTVEAPHKSHRHGNLYTVRVDLRFPGGEAVANRSPSADHSHEDVYLALRDAFRAARRQLQDLQRVRRGDVKTHLARPENRRSE